RPLSLQPFPYTTLFRSGQRPRAPSDLPLAPEAAVPWGRGQPEGLNAAITPHLIAAASAASFRSARRVSVRRLCRRAAPRPMQARSEEHTSELQSRENLE